jgi:hypothetical protein
MTLGDGDVFLEFLDGLTESSAAQVPVHTHADVISEDDLPKYSGELVWHLIMIPPGELPIHKFFHDPMAMKADIKKCQGREDKGGDAGRTRFFIIFGCEAFVTMPPFPHLIHPNGTALALYDKPQKLVVAKDGYSGDEDTRVVLEEEEPEEESNFEPLDVIELEEPVVVLDGEDGSDFADVEYDEYDYGDGDADNESPATEPVGASDSDVPDEEPD